MAPIEDILNSISLAAHQLRSLTLTKADKVQLKKVDTELWELVDAIEEDNEFMGSGA